VGIIGLGTLTSSFYLGLGLTQVPAGIIAAKLGPKKVVVAGIMLSSLTTLGISVSTRLIEVAMLRFVVGAGMACVFAPAVVLGFLLRFLVEWTIALAAFWTTRVTAINQIHFMAVLFFSGQIAPLAVLPYPLRVVAMILPFRWTIGFPVELVLGRLTAGQVLTGFAVQTAWLVAALAILKLAWRASVKNYSAVGA
jgi:ABC-type uncharacterized transport system permease subunit